VVGGLAIGAFLLGAGLGDGAGTAPGAASRLSLAQLAGQRLVAGFDGREAPRPLKEMIRRGELAGVILFSANLPDRNACRRLIGRLQAIRRPPGLRDPLLVMVDQEGGLVKRVAGPPDASAAQMGRRGAAFSRRQGEATAASLRELGIDVDLAPVLDVARPGGTIAETERGFGSTAERVAATAGPFAAGLQAGGVAATAKHFPGLGAASRSTDFAAQRIYLSRQTLRAVDEAPYLRFDEAGGAIVMLSTAIYPAFSSKPAAFARVIATGELRSRLGFEGVSITDALESAAVRSFGGPAKAGVAAAGAGVDLLLFADYRAAATARGALVRRLGRGALDRPEFEHSVERALGLRHRLGTGRG
jgi:beta-N-acetylhexosaminidase